MDDPKSALEKMMRLTVLAALVSALVLGAVALSSCATGEGAAAYKRCANDQERVRIGPRGKPPKYICRDKTDD